MIELEFITLDKVIKEAKWIWNFLEDISCWSKPVSAIYVYYDIQSTIKKA
jgi:hypothetical protein